MANYAAGAPSYPGLQFASKALRVLALIQLVAGAFLAYANAGAGLFPTFMTVVGVLSFTTLLWAASEFCALSLEATEHLRRLSGS